MSSEVDAVLWSPARDAEFHSSLSQLQLIGHRRRDSYSYKPMQTKAGMGNFDVAQPVLDVYVCGGQAMGS